MQILRLAGYCWRSKYELASDLILWQPYHGKRKRGRPANMCIDQLRDDTNFTTIYEREIAMEDREGWKTLVMDYRSSSKW